MKRKMIREFIEESIKTLKLIEEKLKELEEKQAVYENRVDQASKYVESQFFGINLVSYRNTAQDLESKLDAIMKHFDIKLEYKQGYEVVV